jgi:hypothetical protein
LAEITLLTQDIHLQEVLLYVNKDRAEVQRKYRIQVR